jgi:hypothetical protein
MEIERAMEIYLREIDRLSSLEPTRTVRLQRIHVQATYWRRIRKAMKFATQREAELRWINVQALQRTLPGLLPTSPELPRDERYRDWHERTAALLAETLGGGPDDI